jgi:hypothetical protein
MFKPGSFRSATSAGTAERRSAYNLSLWNPAFPTAKHANYKQQIRLRTTSTNFSLQRALKEKSIQMKLQNFVKFSKFLKFFLEEKTSNTFLVVWSVSLQRSIINGINPFLVRELEVRKDNGNWEKGRGVWREKGETTGRTYFLRCE